MQHATYMSLLSQARKLSRKSSDAEDLLQTVLLAAVEAGRGDLANVHNRRWLYGAMRNRAAFEARSALRRRARESAPPWEAQSTPAAPAFPSDFVTSLPPGLASTALLALTGHSRAEIRHLLGLSDAALRQRIAQIKQRWNAAERDPLPAYPWLRGALPFGLIRQALRPAMSQPQAHLGSHDPDGHLFVLALAHKPDTHGNI